MPRLRRLRIGALDDLAMQLRFAPADTLRRQLERAEQLAVEVTPDMNYPEDWVIFRVTGYRPQIDSPALVVGEALIGDMSALVERLSAAARIDESELDPGEFLDAASLQKRWEVSRKSLERYRRRGLIARRVRADRGVSRLAYKLDSVERFEAVWKSRIDRASGFTRIGDRVERRIIRRAKAYRALGCTLSQSARRIATRYNRAHETVRQVLRRSGVDFGKPGPPSPRERRLIERAWWWGIEPSRIARRLSRTSAAVHRVILDTRARRLRSIRFPQEPSMRAGQVEKALAAECCRRGLGVPGATDVLEWITIARETPRCEAEVERTRLLAYHAVLARAARACVDLKAHGNAAGAVDGIETDLRWASRIKAELIRSELPLIVRTLEGALSRPLEEVRAPVLVRLVIDAIADAAEAVDTFHAGKGGRLAAPVGLAVTRVGSRCAREHDREAATRARARLTPGLRIPDWTTRVTPWQSRSGSLWLEPHPSVRAGLGVLEARARRLLELRFGWGEAPRTAAQAATDIKLPLVRALALERRAIALASKAGAS